MNDAAFQQLHELEQLNTELKQAFMEVREQANKERKAFQQECSAKVKSAEERAALLERELASARSAAATSATAASPELEMQVATLKAALMQESERSTTLEKERDTAVASGRQIVEQLRNSMAAMAKEREELQQRLEGAASRDTQEIESKLAASQHAREALQHNALELASKLTAAEQARDELSSKL
ncbi:hypothetical protein, partial [Enterobacter sp. 56-7]|uniref:hypothetical protein n=1 Tax=Enterobacter sp. 56-7 TaxID=1895906 RepID=UPI000AF945EA